MLLFTVYFCDIVHDIRFITMHIFRIFQILASGAAVTYNTCTYIHIMYGSFSFLPFLLKYVWNRGIFSKYFIHLTAWWLDVVTRIFAYRIPSIFYCCFFYQKIRRNNFENVYFQRHIEQNLIASNCLDFFDILLKITFIFPDIL